MTGSVINRILAGPPPPGHTLTMATMAGVSTVPLTDVHARAERLAAALAAAGITRGDRIGILSANRLEWVLLDLAALRLGAVTAGFEPTKFETGPELLARYNLALLFTDVLTRDPLANPSNGPTMGLQPANQPQRRADDGAIAPAPGRRWGKDIRPVTDIAAMIAGTDPTATLPPVEYGPRDVTTIKFTSGSTGQPKGLAATVGSIDSSVNAVQQMFGHEAGDNVFVFLPLSLLQQRYWVYSALAFGHDVTISTYEAAFAMMRRVEPTVVMGVPAFYETAKKHIESRAARTAGGSGPSGARGCPPAGRVPPRASTGDTRSAGRELFGTKVRYLWTGSAPARQSVLRFFGEIGMPIYEGYGLNETCIVAKNHPGAHKEGSVGQVLPGKKVLIDADGVISVASEHPVNWRYEYAEPGESARVFAPDGTVRTGDLGYFDEEGFLHIKGRADDVIVLDNGKKVIVRPLEEFLKASDAIAEAVIFCPTQTHLVAVVSPADDPPDGDAIGVRLTDCNASFGHDEQIKDLVIAAEPFSIDNGLLTSQGKPRRKRIMQAYVRQFNGF